MLQTVLPVLPALIVAHAWMTMIIAYTLSDIETFSLPPESFPA